MSLRTLALTTCAMVAFAANSVLCRLALGDGAIDAAAFSAIRLASGAVALIAIWMIQRRGRGTPLGGGWVSALALFAYAVPFSFAYTRLDTGSGALLLFGAVQATMVIAGLLSGERPGRVEWIGFATAVGGFVYLVSPGVTAPSAIGAALMVSAGIAWGFYSLRGRGATDPTAATAGNFARSLPFVLVVLVLAREDLRVSAFGASLAVASGALASGVGYAIWYAALRSLAVTRAATVQLSVPVIAAAGGVLVAGESVTVRLVASSLLILGGIALSLFSRRARA